MRLSNAQLKARLNFAALVVLALGLAGALLAYVLVDDAPPETGAYVIVDGLKYPIDATATKRYVRDLERMGGKATVVFDEFGRWFMGLWQGRQLALTLACLGTVGSLALLGFARVLPPDD